ncbi:MAG TPA: FKBP-type peptidyl-prolyl cis-trans isomerase [Acidimicrobiales bacterium]|nr:FKBP-type peptidyl-prolyl cis-trans isomerase [Acidimicrobiales bacterium]
MRKLTRTALGVVALGTLAAGCGSSGSASAGSAGSTTTTAGATSTSGGTPATTAITLVTSGLPAVSNAKNMSAAPAPAAGSPPAPTTLQAEDLVVGTGAAAADGMTVKVQYVGANYADGKVFDSSWSRGQPASFPLSGVIEGFKDAIIGMKVGGRREVVIPPNLGYGPQGQPPTIQPNETLVFVIDLLGVQ